MTGQTEREESAGWRWDGVWGVGGIYTLDFSQERERGDANEISSTQKALTGSHFHNARIQVHVCDYPYLRSLHPQIKSI